MRIKNFSFFLLALVLFLSCKEERESNLLALVYDETYTNKWENKMEFSEIQDYVKNLDYAILQNPDIHPAIRELLEVFKSVVDGESFERIILKVQEILTRRKNPDLIQIYTGLVEELLVENGRYKAASENFPKDDKALSLGSAFKDLPEMSINELDAKAQVYDDLEKTDFGQLKVKCKANQTIAFAMFDTGADLTAVSRSFARKAGFFIDEDQYMKIHTVTSINVVAKPGYIQELQVGNVIFKNHPILVFDDKDVTLGNDEVSLKLDFVLGWNAIRNLEIRLDTKSDTFSAKISKPKKVNSRNMFWCGYPAIKVNNDDGQSLIFGIDTGANDTEFKSNVVNKVNFKTPLVNDTISVAGYGGNEKYIVKMAKNISIHISSYKITFRELHIRDNIDLYFIKQDGTIGAEIFQNNMVTMDYKNGIFKIGQ